MQFEVEEAVVPGDEDEDELVTKDTKREKKRKRKKNLKDSRQGKTRRKESRKHKENALRLSSSAPEVIQYDEDQMEAELEQVKRPRTSSTQSTFSSETESCNDMDDDCLQFELETQIVNSAPNLPQQSPIVQKQKKDIRSTPSIRHTHTGIKIPRKMKVPNLRKTYDEKDRKLRIKKLSCEPPSSVMALSFDFQKILSANNSKLLQHLLHYTTRKLYGNATQQRLLQAVSHLLLIPDDIIPTAPVDFLSEYIDHDIEEGFGKEDWEAFASKNIAKGPTYIGLSGEFDKIQWWHVVESLLCTLLSKSNFFRDCFRNLYQKLENNASSSRKKHKIFPYLCSFMTELASDISQYPVILCDTFRNLDTLFFKCCGNLSFGVLFRVTINSIFSILVNPRKWNLEYDMSPTLRDSFQELGDVFVESQLQPNYKCNNAIETSLAERTTEQLQEFLKMVTKPQNLNSSPRVMSWPESRSSLFTIYNHIVQNFEKIWTIILNHNPRISYYFLPFALVGFTACNAECFG